MKDEIFSSLQKASLEIFPEFSGNFQVTKPQDSLLSLIHISEPTRPY